MRRRKPKPSFNNMPIELQSKILDRLSLEDKSKVMCVSHLLRDLILHTILPKEALQLSMSGLFPSLSLVRVLFEMFHWCSRVMQCRVDPKKVIDTSKGLLLFCHNVGRAHNLTHGVYHYYVVNYITKQCLAVLKPVGQTSIRYSYVILAYDPAESWFFKIVRFQGRRHIHVFSSENGDWTTLTFCLPEYITTSCLIKKSVYLKGSIYRLSSSGHLVKIIVNRQENVSEQSKIISLPHGCIYENSHWELSVKDDKVIFVMSKGVNFDVFELVEWVTSDDISYSWCNSHRIKDSRLWYLNYYGELLSYNPNYEIAYFKRSNLPFNYFRIYNNNIIDFKQVEYGEFIKEYLEYCRPLMFECLSSFACCLDKEHPSNFQRLPIPE